jgi:hypothetical protein
MDGFCALEALGQAGSCALPAHDVLLAARPAWLLFVVLLRCMACIVFLLRR